jgi:hypothetical protein
MSYTPDEQQIETPIENCLSHLEELRRRMMNRLLSPDWQEEHKADLRFAISQLTELQITLTRLR